MSSGSFQAIPIAVFDYDSRVGVSGIPGTVAARIETGADRSLVPIPFTAATANW